jgi:hypothetical protein
MFGEEGLNGQTRHSTFMNVGTGQTKECMSGCPLRSSTYRCWILDGHTLTLNALTLVPLIKAHLHTLTLVETKGIPCVHHASCHHGSPYFFDCLLPFGAGSPDHDGLYDIHDVNAALSTRWTFAVSFWRYC